MGLIASWSPKAPLIASSPYGVALALPPVGEDDFGGQFSPAKPDEARGNSQIQENSTYKALVNLAEEAKSLLNGGQRILTDRFNYFSHPRTVRRLKNLAHLGQFWNIAKFGNELTNGVHLIFQSRWPLSRCSDGLGRRW